MQHISSPDGQQKITIITNDTLRYIIDGYTDVVPKENYIKLDISAVPVEGDEVVGCWATNNYQWYLCYDESKIIEDRLDKTKFKFEAHFPIKDGIPTIKSFFRPDCFTFSFDYGELAMKRGDVIIMD
ncbi:MAG: hypothetical protein EOO43_14815 [Flavobacterium sp.]|nr:MAG: hypothetical protein EOO43_14815 [Flavobacterium sp.]